MADEKAGGLTDGDITTSAYPVDELINEHKGEEQPNGEMNGTATKDSGDKAEHESHKIGKESAADDTPSKRVQEGQRWNSRPRKYENNNSNERPFRKRNNKSILTSEKESSDPVAIRKQVEFYFSDSNLLQDKFLFRRVEGHENLPVPISVIHSFRRMQHFQPLSAVVDALKESTTLTVVNEDTCIQRKKPLPEGLVGKPMFEIQKVHEDASMARSIYAKGFGDEEPSTQFDIEAFFANHGTTNSVRLRRTYDQTFKGSVFVEFDSEDTQKSFLSLDPKPQWHGKELLIKSKKQYCDDKVEDINTGKIRAHEDKIPNSHHDKHHYKRRRDSPNYDQGAKGDEKDSRDWRVRREEDRKSGFRGGRGGRARGFGGSGRGRGGHSNRGPRDRNAEHDEKDERGVPKVKPTTSDSGDEGDKDESTAQKSPEKAQDSSKTGDDVPPSEKNGIKPTPSGAETNDKVTTESTSKKRAREEDGAPEGEALSKKVDTKDGES